MHKASHTIWCASLLSTHHSNLMANGHGMLQHFRRRLQHLLFKLLDVTKHGAQQQVKDGILQTVFDAVVAYMAASHLLAAHNPPTAAAHRLAVPFAGKLDAALWAVVLSAAANMQCDSGQSEC